MSVQDKNSHRFTIGKEQMSLAGILPLSSVYICLHRKCIYLTTEKAPTDRVLCTRQIDAKGRIFLPSVVFKLLDISPDDIHLLFPYILGEKLYISKIRQEKSQGI